MSQQPRKSTTHEEYYVHVAIPKGGTRLEDSRGIIVTHQSYLIRKEDDGRYYYAMTWCSAKDKFTHAGGRTNARRAYFQKQQRTPMPDMTVKEFISSLHHQWDAVVAETIGP